MPDRNHYRILKCEKCGLIFSSPILSPKRLSTFYRESLCSYEDQIPYLIETYTKIVNEIKKNLPKNPKVLEVGCGNGFFLKSLLKSGFTKSASGVEPSSEMILQADPILRTKIKVDVFKPSLFPNNSFDLICCFHTLDHMIDPDEFVKGANLLLKKNGYVIAIVHDTNGLSVKMFGENSPIFDIEHIFLFNKKTLREIFVRHNFEAVKVFSLVNKYPLGYWVRMSGFPGVIKKAMGNVLKLLKLDRIDISIPAGNIAIIAKKGLRKSFFT